MYFATLLFNKTFLSKLSMWDIRSVYNEDMDSSYLSFLTNYNGINVNGLCVTYQNYNIKKTHCSSSRLLKFVYITKYISSTAKAISNNKYCKYVSI